MYRLSLALLIALISSTVLGEGLDPVRVGRYSAIVPGPQPEQVDPFALPVHTAFPRAIQTVGGALKHVLKGSGYRLATERASCPSLPALLDWPLPAVHRRLGPMRLDEALKTLAGPAHTLVVDPLHRLVSFELREHYRGLLQQRVAAPRASLTVQGPSTANAQRFPALAAGRAEAMPTARDSLASRHIGPIRPGDRLLSIAVALRKAFQATPEQVMVGLFEANPGSFCYHNLHCLKRGTTLDPPSAARVVASSPADARRTVQRHLAAWHQRGRCNAPLTKRNADATTEEPHP